MDKEEVMWGMLVAAIVAVLAGCLMVASAHSARDRMEKEAVQAGAARWVFDQAGDPHFEWRKP